MTGDIQIAFPGSERALPAPQVEPGDDRNVASMCAEAEQLLTHYLSALSIYHKAALSAAGLADSPKYS
jgi:hypothetical protein